MNYALLLRGVNVGKSVRVNMQDLKTNLALLGFKNVKTYINSGNIIFLSNISKNSIKRKLKEYLTNNYKFEITFVLKKEKEIISIAKSIPSKWTNDINQKTDVLYLFENVDNKNIVEALFTKNKFIKHKYVEGALIINIDRKNYNKSKINKIIYSEFYKNVTARNVNTARKLASLIKY